MTQRKPIKLAKAKPFNQLLHYRAIAVDGKRFVALCEPKGDIVQTTPTKAKVTCKACLFKAKMYGE